MSRFNLLGTSNPNTIVKAKVDSLSLSFVDNYGFYLSRPHRVGSPGAVSKLLSDFDIDVIVSHVSSPLPLSNSENGIDEAEPFSGDILDLSVVFAKPILIEASKAQLQTVCGMYSEYLRLLGMYLHILLLRSNY